MSETRYSAKELRRMGSKALADIGADLGLKFNKNHNRSARAKLILAAYASADVDKATPDDPPSSDVPFQGSPKPDFERLIDSDTLEATPETIPDGRGGARPGAGRPMGQTEGKARMEHLSDRPHPVVEALLCQMFQAWAVAAKCPEIALTKEEAFDLALPWSNVLEYAGVAQRIPPWLHLGIVTLWTTINVVKCKSQLAREAGQRRRLAEAAAAPSQN